MVRKKREDGVFWMPWDAAVQHFDVMHVCRLLRPPRWTTHMELGEWAGEACARLGKGGERGGDATQKGRAIVTRHDRASYSEM